MGNRGRRQPRKCGQLLLLSSPPVPKLAFVQALSHYLSLRPPTNDRLPSIWQHYPRFGLFFYVSLASSSSSSTSSECTVKWLFVYTQSSEAICAWQERTSSGDGAGQGGSGGSAASHLPR